MNNIKTRFTVLFTLVVAGILVLFTIIVYNAEKELYYKEFSSRIKDRAYLAAKLFITPQELDIQKLKETGSNFLHRLPQQGIIIFDSSNVPVFIDDSLKLNISSDLLTTIRVNKELSYTEDRRQVEAFLFPYHHQQFVVIAAAKDAYGQQQLIELRQILLLSAFISLLVIFVTGTLFSNRVLSPLLELSRQAGKINFSNLGTRLQAGKNRDEIFRLAESFNEMLYRLQLSSEIQKTFLANASHELRTPLAVMLSDIDLALMQERDNQYYQETLLNLKNDVKTINELTTKLIELAETNYETLNINFEPLRIDEIIWNAITEISKKYVAYTINVNSLLTNETEKFLMVNADRRLLTSAFINLLDNACKFSPPGSTVDININVEGEKLVLKIVDRGIGISEEESKNIFQPFFRSPRVKNTSGFGLGLSITNAIFQKHNIVLTFNSKYSSGTTATITFI